MIEIALTVCSILHGAACHDERLTFADEGQMITPYACMIGGLSEIAKWSEAHPNWTVSRWRCGEAGRIANI